MNKVILMGRLTRDPDIRYSQGQAPVCIARYTLAVDRKLSAEQRQKEGVQTADYIGCVAFGKNGEFAEKWLKQGTKIVVEGRIQTGKYTNRDGQTVYTTDVVVESHEFAESKSSQPAAPAPVPDAPAPVPDDFVAVPDNLSEDGLPFN